MSVLAFGDGEGPCNEVRHWCQCYVKIVPRSVQTMKDYCKYMEQAVILWNLLSFGKYFLYESVWISGSLGECCQLYRVVH